MAIQVRRGNESDFDASKMLPGEWAVSLDTRYVRMCFAPGLVLRMSTYESFEADMAQIQTILAECRNIQSAVQRIQTEVNSKASLTVEYANDAKESADRAYSEAERAKTYADNAEAVTGVQIATKDRAGLIKGGNNHIAEDGTLMLITTTTSTTQPNSYAGREMVLEIGGAESEQETTAGNNLWSYGDISYGTGSSIPWSISAGEYTFSTATSTFDLTIRVYFNDGTDKVIALSKSPTTFSLEKDVVSFNYNSIIEGTIANIMLNAGTTSLPYEQYTGGIPAPNPSYQMDVDNSVVKGIKTHGKNELKCLFNVDDIFTFHGLTYTIKRDANGEVEYINVNGTATEQTVYVLNSGMNTARNKILSGCTGGDANTYSLVVAYTDEKGNWKTERYQTDSGMYIDDTYPKCDISILVRSGITVNNVKFYPMIREVGTDATYEPYTESNYTFSQPIELYGKDGVQDVIIQKDGTLGVERNILYQKLSLDSMSSNDYGYTFFGSVSNRPFIGVEKYDAFLCTHLKCINRLIWNPTDIDYPCMSAGTYAQGQAGNVNVFFPKSYGIDTVGKFMQWAEDNNVMLAGPKAPTTEALPIADQIGLNSLATYDGITYVEFIYEELEPTFKGKYGTSEVGGYTLEALLTARNNELKQELANERLSALEASVVNNI